MAMLSSNHLAHAFPVLAGLTAIAGALHAVFGIDGDDGWFGGGWSGDAGDRDLGGG
jgi:hypothetical protein